MLLRKRRAGLFHLNHLDHTLPRPVSAVVKPPLESLLGIPRLNAVYDAVMGPGPVAPQDFAQAVLNALDITVNIPRRELDRIPRTGPLVVVANHPFGGVEGLILAAALLKVRPDVKVLANHLLGLIPEMRPLCIFVDVLGKDAAQRNTRGLKESIAHLRAGGALGVFPAGAVAHWRPSQRRVADPAWSEHVAALARRTGAAVVPVHFAGANSAMFQVAGLLNPRLRTVLLPRELLNKRHGIARVRVGAPIPNQRMAGFASDTLAIDYLRRRTDALDAHRHPGNEAPIRRLHAAALSKLPIPRRAGLEPIAPPADPARVASEFDALLSDALLAETGDLCCYALHAAQAPHALHELGRLREITFRAVGEGTGKPLDLDAFDNWYTHLVLWHPQRRQIVGAYRIGATDHILPGRGKRGMYVSTLFDLPDDAWRSLGPTLELGRSFVRPEHQRGFAPLLLLWKGIGAFLVRNPRYRHLLGPVSISNTYTPASRALIAAFLSTAAHRHPLASRVACRTPFHARKAAPPGLLGLVPHLRDTDDLDHAVADVEPDGKGVPVLLRQYLRMGAKALAFNIDPAFGHCVDALCLFDAAAAEARPLRRYMGDAGAEHYLAHHAARLC